MYALQISLDKNKGLFGGLIKRVFGGQTSNFLCMMTEIKITLGRNPWLQILEINSGLKWIL